MTKLKPIEDAPVDFAWPDPLVIDIVCERYPDIADRTERLALARLHAQALREVYAGRDRQAAAARLELIAFCAARRIAPDRVARVDHAVFRELAQVASTCFRASPRTRDAICARLDGALKQVRGEPSQAGETQPVEARVARTRAPARPASSALRRPATVTG